MKKLVEVDIPDGFDVSENQNEKGYYGQRIIVIKLTPITKEAIDSVNLTKQKIDKEMAENGLSFYDGKEK